MKNGIEFWIGKDIKRGRGKLVEGTIASLDWIYWGKPRYLSWFEPGTYRMHVQSVTAIPAFSMFSGANYYFTCTLNYAVNDWLLHRSFTNSLSEFIMRGNKIRMFDKIQRTLLNRHMAHWKRLIYSTLLIFVCLPVKFLGVVKNRYDYLLNNLWMCFESLLPIKISLHIRRLIHLPKIVIICLECRLLNNSSLLY